MPIDLSDPDAYSAGIPHQVFRELRQTDPVSLQHDRLGKPFWAVTRYHDIVAVLRDPAVYSSARGGVLFDDPPPEFLSKLRENMLNRDPPDHTAMRKLVNSAFSPKRLAQLEARIDVHARELVERASEQRELDFARDVAGQMPLFVICEILGVPVADRVALYALTERMFGSTLLDRVAAQADGIAAATEMRAYAAELGRARSETPRDDLVSDLLAASIDGERLTPGEFQAFFMLLFNAGADTTRGLLCMATDLLAEHPAAWVQLQADRALVPATIDEVLRFAGPVIQFRRTATRDCELERRQILEGDRVVVFFPSGNRDETVFDAPDVFDIGRRRVPHLAFGYGTHFCLGAPLARMESKHVLLHMLERWSRVERVEPPRFGRTAFIRSVQQQRIAITLR